jgi:hypothetical protein
MIKDPPLLKIRKDFARPSSAELDIRRLADRLCRGCYEWAGALDHRINRWRH